MNKQQRKSDQMINTLLQISPEWSRSIFHPGSGQQPTIPSPSAGSWTSSGPSEWGADQLVTGRQMIG